MMDELSAALQDYLEGVLVLEEAHGEARVGDLAAFLKVKRPSVVKSLSRLKDLGMITQRPYRPVMLTPQGRSAARAISHRHIILKSFFTDVLNVNDRTAEQDACRAEHVISPVTLKRLEQFLKTCANGRARPGEAS